ncbi:unnamed protein product [Chilo suppressalis]|uniref:Uncharacterized protein n=1 Tax=Chilo suppressalis TaxID=168631 RepID=A0ABN8LF64_CHISP|nr:unnamed protein product [Chilo suppressalis]
MFEEEEEDSGMTAVRYACMPSLVSLQLMRNRLHLAYLGRKLMKWSALATGRELRKIAMQLDMVYDSFGEDLRNAFMLLARGRYFCPMMNKMVIENIAEEASVRAKSTLRMVTGVKIPQYEIVESGVEPYEHLGIEKGGQQIHEAKVAWLDLLKRLILIVQLRVSFTLVELANKSATKRKNVLSKTVTPRIMATLMYIMSELEEQAREETFRLKRVKQNKTKKSDSQKKDRQFDPEDPVCTCNMLELDDEDITEMLYPNGTNSFKNISETTVTSKHSAKPYDDEDKKQLDYLLTHVDEIVQNLEKQKEISKSTEQLIETCNKFKGTIKSLTTTTPSQSSHPPQNSKPQLSKASSSSSNGDNVKKAGSCGHSCYRMITQEIGRDTSTMRSTASEYHKRCIAPIDVDQKNYMPVPQSKTDEYLKVDSHEAGNKETPCPCYKTKSSSATDQSKVKLTTPNLKTEEYLKIYLSDEEESAVNKVGLCPTCAEKPKVNNLDRIENMSAPQSKSEEYIKEHLLHQNKSAGSKKDRCSKCGKNTENCLTSDIQERIELMSAPQSQSEEYVKKHLMQQNKSAALKEAMCSNCGKKTVNGMPPDVQDRIQLMSAPQSQSEEYVKKHLLHQNKSAALKEAICSNCGKKTVNGIPPDVQDRIQLMSAPQSQSEEYVKKHLMQQNKSTALKEAMCSNCGKKTVNGMPPDVQDRIQLMSAPQSQSEEYVKKHLLHQNKSAALKEAICSNCGKKTVNGIPSDVQDRIQLMSAPQSQSEEYVKKHLVHQNKSAALKEAMCSNCGKKTVNDTSLNVQERIQLMSAPQSKSEEYVRKHLLHQNKMAALKEAMCSNCGKKSVNAISPDVQDRIQLMSAPQSKSEEYVRKHLLHQNKSATSKESLCFNCAKNAAKGLPPDVQDRIQLMSAPQSQSEEYLRKHLFHQNKSDKSSKAVCSDCAKKAKDTIDPDMLKRIDYISAPESEPEEYIIKHLLCSNCAKKAETPMAPDIQERIQYMSAPQSQSEEYVRKHLLHQNKLNGSKGALCSNCVKKVHSGITPEIQERIDYMSAPESESEEYIKKHLSNQNKSAGSKEIMCTVCASRTGKKDELVPESKSKCCSKTNSLGAGLMVKSPSPSQKDVCCKVASKENEVVTSGKEKETINCDKCSAGGKLDTIEMDRTSSSEYHKRCFPEKPQQKDKGPDSCSKLNEANKQTPCGVCSSQEKLGVCSPRRSGSAEAIWRDTCTSTTDFDVVPSTMPSKSTLKQCSKYKKEHSNTAIKIIAKPSSRYKSDKQSIGGISASSECLTCNYSSKTKSLNESDTNALCKQCRHKFDGKTKRGASESNVCKRCQANFENSVTRTSSNRCPRCKKEKSFTKHTCPMCQSENSSISDFQGGLSLGSEKSKCGLCGKESTNRTCQDVDSLGLKSCILSFIKAKLLSERPEDEIPCPRCNARKDAERCETACLLCKKRMSKTSKFSEDWNSGGSCTFSNKSRDPGRGFCASQDSDDEEVCCGTQTVAKHSCKFDDNVQVACIPDNDKTGEVSVQEDSTVKTKESGVNTRTADRYDVRPVHLLSRNTSRSSCSCKPGASLNLCRCKSAPTCNSKHKSLRDVRSYDL